MSILVTIYLLAGILYIIMGINVININRESQPHRIFNMLSITLAFWAFAMALMSACDTPESAAIYRWSATMSWSIVYAEILSFVLVITNRANTYNKTWFKTLLYIPAFVCFLLYILNPIPAEYMVQINGGWAFSNPQGMGFFYNNYSSVYFLVYIVTAAVLLVKQASKAKFVRERKQAQTMLIVTMIVGVIALVTDVIFPMLGLFKLPPITVIAGVIAVGGISVAIKMYSLMSVTGDSLILEMSKVMTEGVIICDYNKKVLRMNKGAEKILGYNREQLNKQGKLEEICQVDLWNGNKSKDSVECNVIGYDKKITPVLVNINYMTDRFGESRGTVLYINDLTEIKAVTDALEEEKNKLEYRVEARTRSLEDTKDQLETEIHLRKVREKEIEKMAFSDHLTGLPNRRMFSSYLDTEIEQTLRTKMPFAVLFIDLDGFKLVNDSLGHGAGDILLQIVAERLGKNLRKSDLIARIGGDEFAVLLFNPRDYKAIEKICSNLINAIEKPYKLQKSEVFISASIGIAVCPNDGEKATVLLKNADIAMYEAKDNGKGGYAFFKKEKQEDLEKAMKLSNDLYRALENNELEVYYQPQVSVETENITGFEALVRWRHPDLGMLLPESFIGIAERTGLINSIGLWVFKIACIQLKEWNQKFNIDMKMAINLSVKQLENRTIEDDILKIIEKYDINPNTIELEITESMLTRDIEQTIKVVNNLNQMGIRIAIDDFGSEYSSLGYIKHLSVNRIKIPKPFIDGINDNKSDESIISSTIMLAKELGMDVVAEGVEEEAQYEYLKSRDCDIIQGFLFYKPMPSSKIEEELGPSNKKVHQTVFKK